MAFIIYLAKIYIVILLFRFVSTKQELTFNPLGRILAKLTNPVLPNNSNNFIPVLIILLVVVTSLLNSISSNNLEFLSKLMSSLINYIFLYAFLHSFYDFWQLW